jgi:hypothetical protein
MSTLGELKQGHCPRFLSGRWCFGQKQCGLIHDRSIYRAARKEKQSDKHQYNSGGSQVTSCAQKDNDVKAAVFSSKNETLKGSQYGRLVHNQAVGVVPNPLATRRKSKKPVKDAQSSNSGKSQGNNRGKKVSESVDYVKTANSAHNSPMTAKNTLSFNLNQILPNMSSGRHADGPSVEGNYFYPGPEVYLANQYIASTISTTKSAVYINTTWAKYGIAKFGYLGDNHDEFGRKAVEWIENRNYEEHAEEAVRLRVARYVLRSPITFNNF